MAVVRALLVFAFLFAFFAALAQPTELRIDRTAGPARVSLSGQVAQEYVLESCTNLASGTWDYLLTTPLINSPQTWFDARSLLLPERFYRAVKLDAPTSSLNAPNFRLIDHLGVSRELYYHWSDPGVRAVVLIFTGNGCAKVHQMIGPMHSLRTRFAPQGVLFWMIDSNSGDNRSNILAEATSRGIQMPILHDAAQLVAREFGAATTPEAIALNRTDFYWSVFYRGALDDRLAGNAVATTQYYLSNALVHVLGGTPVAPIATRAEGCAITLNPPQPISYSTDIAPFINNKCVRCHSQGNIAPFAFDSHATVAGYASAIKAEVLHGHMPPWHADPHYGVFTNDFSLRPAEMARLVQWINDGAPRGDGPDPLETVAPATNYPFAWPASLGPPTRIYSIPVQSIPAAGDVDYRYINVTTTFTNDVWLSAAVIKPGNIRVVHHSLVFQGTGGLNGLDGFFAGYVPGYDAVAFPPSTGKLLPRGTVLRFQMHYVTTGQPETDETQIGLYVAPAAPAYSLQTKSAFNVFFSIPPGAAEYEATAQYGPLNRNILLYEMSPHMHLRGSRFRYEALYQDGRRETLLSVPHYIFHWQALYRFTTPKFLPVGTRILCTGAWDNTAQNPHNPDPTATITFGEQTYEEMFIGYMNFAELP